MIKLIKLNVIKEEEIKEGSVIGHCPLPGTVSPLPVDELMFGLPMVRLKFHNNFGLRSIPSFITGVVGPFPSYGFQKKMCHFTIR